MNKQAKPLVVLYGYSPQADTMTFLGRDNEITFKLPEEIEIIQAMLKHCSGRKTWEEILKIEKIDPELFWFLAEFLEENEIVVNGSDAHKIFHEDSSNPLRFSNFLTVSQIGELVEVRAQPNFGGVSVGLSAKHTAFGELCSDRRSVRSFSDESIDFLTLGTFLSAIYGVDKNRPTPSAGQIYALEVYLIAMTSTAELPRGIYWFNSINKSLVKKDLNFTDDEIAFAMNTNLVDSAQYIICIAANIDRISKKYSNRAYRFANIEAGHICQNAYLSATELGLGITSYGGFLDKHLKALISDYSLNMQPLITMMLGYEGDPDKQPVDYGTLCAQLNEELVGDKKPIEWVGCRPIAQGSLQLPKFCSNAKYRIVDPNLGGKDMEQDMFGLGMASSDSEANVKSIAEAYERYVASVIRFDIKSKASDLSSQWLNPDELAPMSNSAKERYGIADFSAHQEIEWAQGYRYSSGEKVLAPLDYIHYPISTKTINRNLIYSSSSSGVAAFTDYQTAIRKAVYELVERDALAVLWYSKKEGTTIPKDFIPPDINKRVKYWEMNGWEVRFVNITLDSSPVVMALIGSEHKYPCFSAGASSCDNYLDAIKKAWDEAEILMWGWKKRHLKKKRLPEDVITPLDHGRLYFLSHYYERISWLFNFKEKYPDDLDATVNPLEKFDPVIFDLTIPEYSTIKVVRAISEKLMPISFGYMSEHFGHRRLTDLGLAWNESVPAFPHFLA